MRDQGLPVGAIPDFASRNPGYVYVFRYGYDGERLVMLRVFHGRERRERAT